VKGTSISTGTNLSNLETTDFLIQVSFPSSYVTSFPDNVEYTIYTQEYFSFYVNLLKHFN
jgi:hypothetical protein